MSRFAGLGLGFAIIALLAGCASHQPPAASEPALRFGIISTRPAIEALAGETIFPLTADESTCVLMTDQRSDGEAISLRRAATSEHGAIIAASEGEQRVEFLRRNDDGSIALTAMIERSDNALTLFEPPLIVAPATLRPNEPFTSEAEMRVVALDNPKKQRERGSAKRVITYSTDALIQTPDGDVETAKVEIHFTADLRFADADERTTLYISRDAGGSGFVASDSVEKVTILGAFPREKRRMMLREP